MLNMLNTILVPLDDSTATRHILPYAQTLARTAGARLVLLQVVPDVSLQDHAAAVLGSVADEAGCAGLRVYCVVRLGRPAPAILATAYDTGAEVIAMATQAWSDVDRWLNGSVADEVLRHSHVPVLLASPACEQDWPTATGLRTLVPLDGSPSAEEVLEAACHIPGRGPQHLVLLRAIEPGMPTAEAEGYLREVADRLASQGIEVETVAVPGDPASAITEAARQQQVHLIAMATHGRTGFARLVLGSVATRVLQQAGVPLLLVRPAALRQVGDEESPAPLEARPDRSLPVAPSWLGG